MKNWLSTKWSFVRICNTTMWRATKKRAFGISQASFCNIHSSSISFELNFVLFWVTTKTTHCNVNSENGNGGDGNVLEISIVTIFVRRMEGSEEKVGFFREKASLTTGKNLCFADKKHVSSSAHQWENANGVLRGNCYCFMRRWMVNILARISSYSCRWSFFGVNWCWRNNNNRHAELSGKKHCMTVVHTIITNDIT
jgi:hypothetical protein